MREFQNYYETIIFTALPRRFLDAILTQVPELNICVNFFICQEECQLQEDYLVKDISILMGERKMENIYVIDPNPE
jgi:TFIIF-interacting CTD phosphatase-like protein